MNYSRNPITPKQQKFSFVKFLGIAFLLAVLVVGYKGYRFYQTTIKPVANSVSKLIPKISMIEREMDPTKVASQLAQDYSISIPKGYKGGFGIKFAAFGRTYLKTIAVIPANRTPQQLFSAAGSGFKIRPGNDSVFLFVQLQTTDRNKIAAAASMFASGNSNGKPAEEVTIPRRGMPAIAYKSTRLINNRWSVVYTVFMDYGRVLTAYGPQSGFDLNAFYAFVRGLANAHPNDSLLFARADTLSKHAIDPQCGMKGLPNDYEVHVVSVYKGSFPVKYQLGNSGHEVKEERVNVGKTSKPVVLVLNAYDPVMWEIGKIAGTQIAGVLVNGYHKPGVTGLLPNIPLTILHSETGGNSCEYLSISRNRPSSRDIESIIKHVGKAPASFLTRKQGTAFQVGVVNARASYKPDTRTHYIRSPKLLSAGGQGLNQLVNKGFLRRATLADYKAWRRGAARNYQTKSLKKEDKRIESIAFSSRLYYLLKQTDLPEGLYGANRIFLIVPKGLKFPGNRGHSVFFSMADYRCHSAFPDCSMKRLSH